MVTRRSQLMGLGAPASSQAKTIVQAARSAAGIAGEIALSQINGVTFRSQVSPPIDLTAGQAVGKDPAPGGLSTLFLRVAKPAVYVDTSLGTLRISPWGEPTMNLYPVLLIGALVGAGFLGGVIYRGLTRA